MSLAAQLRSLVGQTEGMPEQKKQERGEKNVNPIMKLFEAKGASK